MSSPFRRLHITLTALFTLAVALLAAQPRLAVAQTISAISLSAGYSFSTTTVNRFVPFTVNATNSSPDPELITFAIQFPAGANLVSAEAVGTGCTINAGEVAPSIIEANASVPGGAGGGCAFGFGLKFAIPGVYGLNDHGYDTPATFVFSNPNITVTAPDVEPTPAPAPATCAVTPDMAVSPELIDLAPGGTATVEIALRNLCNDAPFSDADLLVSFSDGLTVTDGSAGMVNLGQRAAWQKFALAPGETRTWSVTVSAAANQAVAPQHISELYHRGGVASRIDGVFITPAPAPAPVIETAPAPAPAPAAPAPIPAALPNTAGERDANSSLPLAALLLTALGGAALLLRRR